MAPAACVTDMQILNVLWACKMMHVLLACRMVHVLQACKEPAEAPYYDSCCMCCRHTKTKQRRMQVQWFKCMSYAASQHQQSQLVVTLVHVL